MQNNLNNQNPVEFFSAERIKIEIDSRIGSIRLGE